MQRFSSPFGAVMFTEERKAHILAFHPDVSRYLKHFASVLAEPEVITRSVSDQTVVICYGLLPRSRKYLAVVLKTGRNPFVLTAYVAKKPKSL
ncbi:MAG: hypothetical protein KGI78_03455 [Patescibacteria group bacterium]|nr:hypothetical protein [Patescibacteria group bacterium]MDE1944160.1 hypothetical protein [Patescibacteria group bacterium]MDE1945090.1 hypothetical protein [Patescibacteria group bacterium]MDE2057884.1 hypothetical protein [Patescibacteria group bacterium]